MNLEFAPFYFIGRAPILNPMKEEAYLIQKTRRRPPPVVWLMRFVCPFSIILLFSLLGCSQTFPVKPFPTQPAWSVYFSPDGGCTEAIVAELGMAPNIILVQAYSFTSEPIADGLVDAHKRGVKVMVILDGGRKNEKKNQRQTVLLMQGLRRGLTPITPKHTTKS